MIEHPRARNTDPSTSHLAANSIKTASQAHAETSYMDQMMWQMADDLENLKQIDPKFQDQFNKIFGVDK